jgi:cobalt-zinc-cadmium resistance protein CzcA
MMKQHFKFILLIWSITTVNIIYGQVPISLKSAIDSATKNNLLLRNERLKADYQRMLIKTSANIPQTSVGFEYGQLNSWYSDTRFGIAQSINFPTVYSKQKALLTATWQSSVTQAKLKEKELIKEVSNVYYLLYYLFEKEKILVRSDSIYNDFLIKANLNFKIGESNILEKITAETQSGQIANQLNELRADIKIIQFQFQYLLNVRTVFVPSEISFKLNYIANTDSSQLVQHTSVLMAKQQKLIAEKNTALEQSKLLPDLGLSYSNMSMRGEGADRQSYTTATRFQSFQFGIGIPLFYGSQKASINASKINENIANSNYDNAVHQIKNEFFKAQQQFIKNTQMVDYYETLALKNANTIINTAKRQLLNGEINYIEFVLLTNQAIAIQNEYINVVKNLNESIINLNYLEQ